MSVINNGLLLASQAAAAGPYSINRSLRFNSADSAYLSKNFASAGNRNTWTFSCWLKLGAKLLDGTSNFVVFTDSGYNTGLHIRRAGVSYALAIEFFSVSGATVVLDLFTTQVFRDPSAWYHLVFFFDLGNATQADRAQIFINGSRITSFASTTNTISTSSVGRDINNNVDHYIGRGSSQYADGYLADIHFIDGQALTPSSFGEFDATTGVWNPKAYTGSYGTNGFRLPLTDNSGTTSTTLGKDSAGSNNWTPNNFSVASGSGNDSLVDSPTNGTASSGGDAGGTVVGNYCTANPLDNGGQTLANGNLDVTGVSSNWRGTRGTFGMSSGKWYWEITIGFTNGAGNQSLLGIATAAAAISGNYASSGVYGWEYYSNNGNKFNSGSVGSYGSSYTLNDVIGVAFDADNGTLTFYKNGTSQGTAFTGLTSGPYFPSISLYSTSLVSVNWGSRPFAYAAPSGFKSLNTANLPTPPILAGNTAFDTKLYTGNGSTQTISGLGFNPDLVWIKSRSNAYDHGLFDVVRGATARLVSNATQAEDTQSGVTAFNSDGFSLGSYAGQNGSSATYAAWCWDAGTTTSSNGSGSITSTVRANASAGFSVVTYTANAPNNTIGHGLGAVPSFVIVKSRSRADNWYVYHSALGVSQWFNLNTTSASTSSTNYWGTTGNWTSTTFGVNTNGTAGNNYGSDSMVAYCFAPVAGYSAFGSYTGNGSTDGPFVYTGFRVKWLMIKRTDSTSNWYMIDAARSPYNEVNDLLYAEQALTETVDDGNNGIDFLSNGFKLRKGVGGTNVNGATLIYAAFASNPFSIARAA